MDDEVESIGDLFGKIHKLDVASVIESIPDLDNKLFRKLAIAVSEELTIRKERATNG